MNAQSGPHINGQPHPGMVGMTASQQQQQLAQNGAEPTFVRRVARRSRAQTEESDDSEMSELSGKNGQGSEGNSHKRQALGQGVNGTGDEKMDEEEKRKNFLERNRQGKTMILAPLLPYLVFQRGCFFYHNPIFINIVNFRNYFSRTQMSTAQEAVAVQLAGQGRVPFYGQ